MINSANNGSIDRTVLRVWSRSPQEQQPVANSQLDGDNSGNTTEKMRLAEKKLLFPGRDIFPGRAKGMGNQSEDEKQTKKKGGQPQKEDAPSKGNTVDDLFNPHRDSQPEPRRSTCHGTRLPTSTAQPRRRSERLRALRAHPGKETASDPSMEE